MFRLEKTWQHLAPRVRRRRRRSKIRPLLKQFWQWVDHYDGLAKSRLGKAVTYAADQRMYLSRIVNDGTMDWSNNTAERTMKSLVIGRKNWLFSTSPEGARSTAIWMTIVDSAKANHIDPTKYIEYILLGVAQLPTFPKKEQLASYLPWNFKESDLEAVKRAQAGVLIPDKNEEKNETYQASFYICDKIAVFNTVSYLLLTLKRIGYGFRNLTNFFNRITLIRE